MAIFRATPYTIEESIKYRVKKHSPVKIKLLLADKGSYFLSIFTYLWRISQKIKHQ